MGNRLRGEVAIVVGAGQTPGDTIGNGKAIAILFARERAKVMLVDRRLESPIEMESMFKKGRSNPRVVINFPLEHHDMGDSCFHRAMVVNAGQGGSLIETVRDIPVDTELNVTVLFPNGFELANFRRMAKIVWKKPYRKEGWKGFQYWEGYQYGSEFIQILEKDRRKLDLFLGGRFEFEEFFQGLNYCTI